MYTALQLITVEENRTGVPAAATVTFPREIKDIFISCSVSVCRREPCATRARNVQGAGARHSCGERRSEWLRHPPGSARHPCRGSRRAPWLRSWNSAVLLVWVRSLLISCRFSCSDVCECSVLRLSDGHFSPSTDWSPLLDLAVLLHAEGVKSFQKLSYSFSSYAWRVNSASLLDKMNSTTSSTVSGLFLTASCKS